VAIVGELEEQEDLENLFQALRHGQQVLLQQVEMQDQLQQHLMQL
jgi:hypothetical protein